MPRCRRAPQDGQFRMRFLERQGRRVLWGAANRYPVACGWRRERDSNPRTFRSTVFKTAAFDRSAIPPPQMLAHRKFSCQGGIWDEFVPRRNHADNHERTGDESLHVSGASFGSRGGNVNGETGGLSVERYLHPVGNCQIRQCMAMRHPRNHGNRIFSGQFQD
jgi:hypothetical protein